MIRTINKRRDQVQCNYTEKEWRSIKTCAQKVILLWLCDVTDLDTIKRRSGIKNRMMFNAVMQYINQNTEYEISQNKRGHPEISITEKSPNQSVSKLTGRSLKFSLKDADLEFPEKWERKARVYSKHVFVEAR